MSTGSFTEIFKAPAAEFQAVSTKLIRARWLSLAMFFVPLAVGIGLLTWLVHLAFAAGFVALGALLGWLLWLVPRQVGSYGYYCGESDLFIRKGIMFQRMNVLPYGRIQYVHINQGPVQRSCGIAEIAVHTASAGSSGTIPGLPEAEASRLRQELTRNAETHLMGL